MKPAISSHQLRIETERRGYKKSGPQFPESRLNIFLDDGGFSSSSYQPAGFRQSMASWRGASHRQPQRRAQQPGDVMP